MSVRKCAGKIAVLALLAGLFDAGAPATGVQLKPGQYAMTVTYEVQEQRQNELRTAARCITTADLDDPEKVFDERTSAVQNRDVCPVKNLKSAGAKISYDAECANRTVHVEGSLSETGFSVVRTVTPKASPGVQLKFIVAGKRTGDCGPK
ncbi:MAG TPA: DUF3617 family protein [Candidatus Acidoferrum sp.]|nr:DUF3617 family protein [Candidatus Acidoferrum sp.]